MHSIELTRTTTATSQRLMEAVSTAAGIGGWWAKDMDAEGQRYTLRFDKAGTMVTMVFRVDEIGERHVRWTCLENANPVWPGTTLTWTVRDGAIDFVHSGFAETDSPPFQMTAQGWEHFCNSLVQWAETGTGQPG